MGIPLSEDCAIYLGDTNIVHMKKRHPSAFERYAHHIPAILAEPDFVKLNNKDASIEYVKTFLIENEYVKVAVRLSTSGKYYARSLYVLDRGRTERFISKGILKPVPKKI